MAVRMQAGALAQALERGRSGGLREGLEHALPRGADGSGVGPQSLRWVHRVEAQGRSGLDQFQGDRFAGGRRPMFDGESC